MKLDKHEHLDSLNCLKCGKKMRFLEKRSHLFGCEEYEIFLCDECKILIINYPHGDSDGESGKRNKIIEI